MHVVCIYTSPIPIAIPVHAPFPPYICSLVRSCLPSCSYLMYVSPWHLSLMCGVCSADDCRNIMSAASPTSLVDVVVSCSDLSDVIRPSTSLLIWSLKSLLFTCNFMRVPFTCCGIVIFSSYVIINYRLMFSFVFRA